MNLESVETVHTKLSGCQVCSRIPFAALIIDHHASFVPPVHLQTGWPLLTEEVFGDPDSRRQPRSVVIKQHQQDEATDEEPEDSEHIHFDWNEHSYLEIPPGNRIKRKNPNPIPK